MRRFRSILFLGASIVYPEAPVAHAQPVCRYEVAGIIQGPELPFWGHPATIATGLNNHGEVVGYYSYVGDARAFYWSQETGFVALPPIPGAYDSQATDINDHGVIVGYARGDNWGMTGWVFENGHYTYLSPLPGGAWIEARAINNHGQVVGYRSIGDAQPGGPDADTVNPWAGFVWKDGVFTDIVLSEYNTTATEINDSGLVVGWTGMCAGCNDARAFMLSVDSAILLPPVPGGAQSEALAITSGGIVVGASRVFTNGFQFPLPHAVQWVNGDSLELEMPRQFNMSTANEASDNGWMVGSVRRLQGESSGPIHGALWHDGEFRFVDVGPIGVVRELSAINQRGSVVGHFSSTPCTCSALLRPVYTIGDIDEDCFVGLSDLDLLIAHWGSFHEPCDLDNDQTVGLGDLGMLLSAWSVK